MNADSNYAAAIGFLCGAAHKAMKEGVLTADDAKTASEAINLLFTALGNNALALRPLEPTEAMLDAARDWSRAKYGRPIGSDAAIGCWQIMYRAAAVAPEDAADVG